MCYIFEVPLQRLYKRVVLILVAFVNMHRVVSSIDRNGVAVGDAVAAWCYGTPFAVVLDRQFEAVDERVVIPLVSARSFAEKRVFRRPGFHVAQLGVFLLVVVAHGGRVGVPDGVRRVLHHLHLGCRRRNNVHGGLFRLSKYKGRHQDAKKDDGHRQFKRKPHFFNRFIY
jgi:hypothetical protein